MSMGVWADIMTVHNVALRELPDLEGDRADRVESLLGTVFLLFLKANAFKSGTVLSGRLAQALIRSDGFHAYARLIASWGEVPPQQMDGKLRLLAQFSLIFSSCCQLGVGDHVPLSESDPPGLTFYARCLRALNSSQLLEHMCRGLLSLQAGAQAARAAGTLSAQAAHNVSLGVMEACGCVVSALHGIAGKRGVLDACCGPYTWWPARPAEPEAVEVLADVRAVLSGPCLQFLLGREVVASRLRFLDGVGSSHGLPAAHLPEFTPAPNGAPFIANAVAADRLLSRLGAASLVWHMTTSGPRRLQLPAGPEQPPVAPPLMPAVPGMPYKAVHVYDMVAAAVTAVVDDTPAEHLPGGSQLTIAEPALLLVRLVMQLRRPHAAARLPGLWRTISSLMRRPHVVLHYSRNRPLYLFGLLLQWDPEAPSVHGPGQAPAAAAAAAVQGAAQAHGHAAEQGTQDAAAAAQAAGDGAAAPAPGGADADAGAAAASAGATPTGAGGCANSLRIALDAGLLTAVEVLMRRWAACRLDGNEFASCLVLHNAMLRATGQWPAVLAHGSVRDVASLVVTLRRVVDVWAERAADVANEVQLAASVTYMEVIFVYVAYQTALLEQIGEVLQPPGWVAHGSAAPALAAGGDGGAVPERAGGVPGGNALPLNASLAALDSPPLLPESLLRAGGSPTPGSRAAQQQALLAVYSLTQWLPQALRVMEAQGSCYPKHVAEVLARWALVAALQHLAAKQRLEAAAVEAAAVEAAAAPAAAAANAEAADGTLEAAAAVASWRFFLLERLNLGGWLCTVLGWAVAIEHDPQFAEDIGEHFAEMLPVALDALEVLLVSLPLGVALRVRRPDSGGGDGAAEARAGTSSAVAAMVAAVAAGGPTAAAASAFVAATALGAKREVVLDQALEMLLLRHGRQRLLAALEWCASGGEPRAATASGRPADEDATGDRNSIEGERCGDAVATAVALVRSEVTAMAAAVTGGKDVERSMTAPRILLAEVLERYGLAREALVLPPPSHAITAAALAGVVPCANPACVTLEGPSHAALSCRKTCSRCRAVSYCSGACQLAHWRTGHKAECVALVTDGAAGAKPHG